MGLQEVPCAHSTLFLMGLYKMKEYIERSQFILQHVLGEYIIGFDEEHPNDWNWDNWDLIERAITPFTTERQVTQAGISKNFETSDNSGTSDGFKTPTAVTTNHGACVHVYEFLNEQNILKDPNAIRISYDEDEDIPIENIQIWVSILNSYGNIRSNLESLYILAYSISPLYYSPKQKMVSPFQLQLYKSDLMDFDVLLDKNYVPPQRVNFYDELKDASYHRIHWNLIHEFFPDLIHTLRKEYWVNFIRLSINTPSTETDRIIVYKNVGSG